MKILTIVGARPQFVKAAPVSLALRNAGHEEVLVHTGQHYDRNMSEVFFEEMGIPGATHNLAVGSGGHGAQTGRMMEKLEEVMLGERPDAVLVYGDTNSTLAGALVAAKLHIPVLHVEAGLRSWVRAMPEEVNRVVADHLSALLLCPTLVAMSNLKGEGITEGVKHVGDVMYDAAIMFGDVAREKSRVVSDLGLSGEYVLATVHRAENTDREERLRGVFEGLLKVAEEMEVVLPLHPRTLGKLDAIGLLERVRAGLRLLEPQGFLDMVRLEQGAKVIVTDSGGVQKEAYFHSVPCVTMRDETEWGETVESGWNVLVGCDAEKISGAVAAAKPGREITDYGTGSAAQRVVEEIEEWGGGR